MNGLILLLAKILTQVAGETAAAAERAADFEGMDAFRLSAEAFGPLSQCEVIGSSWQKVVLVPKLTRKQAQLDICLHQLQRTVQKGLS